MEKRAEVRIKTYAYILHIKDKYVDIREHFSSRLIDLTVQTVNWQSRALIGSIAHSRAVQGCAPETVFRSKKGSNVDVCAAQSIQRQGQVWQDSRGHRNEAYPPICQCVSLLVHKNVEPGFNHNQSYD
jgi:hypothetical protein